MTAYDLRISDWSSDVCSSDLKHRPCPSQPRLRTLCPLRTHAPAAGAHAVMPARSDLPRFPMKARLRKSSVLLALCLLPLAGCRDDAPQALGTLRSEEHTSELQSLMRISYAVFCLKNKIKKTRC